jgi:hypothetical protein
LQRFVAIRTERSIWIFGLTAAIRGVCTSNKLDRRRERPLSLSCPIWFAAAAKVRFPPLLFCATARVLRRCHNQHESAGRPLSGEVAINIGRCWRYTTGWTALQTSISSNSSCEKTNS